MSMLYREGREAFYRLQEEIIKHSEDYSFLLWTTVPDSVEFSKRASFKPFPRLPPELRQQIWSIAASSPPTPPTPRVCIFSKTSNPPRLVVHEPRNWALLATNTEARHVALMAPIPTRDYNPEIDILYIPRRSLNSFRTALFQPLTPEWVRKTRRLALPSTEVCRVLANPDFVTRLFSLDTLSIVYPAGSGTVDYFQDVTFPVEEGYMFLRRLSQDELAAITIKADYAHGTRVGTFPIRWTRTGIDYLNWAEATLDRSGREGELGGSPLWDDQAGHVWISYEGRCFEALTVPKTFDM
ncbi:hypothetical protein C8A01DRAFT_40692 [Parachaetomium inaequale]|uniref:2EXR domain-containing protein n=1 Tax=Parachaetomium inaequale TaxID=2588326 RepID=A0AAN6SMS6_9PEZI|nr:hypothetical protein C8A01DRAFT_40692 [Parachaetomium inaequale]